ncbi:MAG: class I SAM-dependent methyltransferase [Gemmatimonadaceae bacterium]
MNDSLAIERNRRGHDRFAGAYDKRHPEIFNDVEQARLAAALARAMALAGDGARECVRALDVGSGTGNITRRLVALGAHVTAADLSPKLLAEVTRRLGSSGQVTTLALNGRNLDPIPDGSYDLVVAYSVLHHIPDYAALVSEMARVVRPGGIVYLDHERSEGSWTSAEYQHFLREAVVTPSRRRWWYWLQPSRYWKRLRPALEWRRWIDRRWMPEGDLHIWPDDHIEWARIECALADRGCALVHSEEYLLFEPRFRRDVWESWRTRCSDMRMLIARRAA